MKSGTDIHGALGMNATDFGLAFYLASSAGQNCNLSNTLVYLSIWFYLDWKLQPFRDTNICVPRTSFMTWKEKMSSYDRKMTKPKKILTCGEGSCWGICPSSRVVSSVSPKICLRCWAMTVCCSTPQWFSRDRMTGKSDVCQTRMRRH